MFLELYIFIFFLLGLIVGSFLNVVILRYNTGKGIGGRSECLSCTKQLKWYELLPILSFLSLRGKCNGCKSRISFQYPLVEISTALLFAFTANSLLPVFIQGNYLFGTLHLVIFLIIWSFMVLIFVYDIKHKIIPNSWVYISAGLALLLMVVRSIFFFHIYITPLWLDLLAGPIFFIPFFLLWFVSSGRWIGLGDGKLALVIGWTLGLVYGISAIILAFWIGATISVLVLLLNKFIFSKKDKLGLKSEIPFAPFMIIGLLLGFFFQIDILGLWIFFI